jgi:hypothetical protein
MDKDESDDEAYREFVASGDEDEDQEEGFDRDNIEAYRQKLLGSLSGSGDIKDVFRKRDLQADKGEEELHI